MDNTIKNLQTLFDVAWEENMNGRGTDITRMITTYIPGVIQNLQALQDVPNIEEDQFIKLTTCESGDWQILEINGVEWASGHSLSENDWLGLLSEHFDCMIERTCIPDWEMELRC